MAFINLLMFIIAHFVSHRCLHHMQWGLFLNTFRQCFLVYRLQEVIVDGSTSMISESCNSRSSCSRLSWRSWACILVCVQITSAAFGWLKCMTIVLTYLSVSSLAIGASNSLAFYIVSIANAATAVGRLMGGFLAVKYGVLNIIIIFTTIAAICTYIWPFVTSVSGFIVITCFYG